MRSYAMLGPYALPKDMATCVFHYWDVISANIGHIRETAAGASPEFSKLLRTNEQEAIAEVRQYNNTISILGSRGSGKTSVIMTLQKDLRDGRSEQEKYAGLPEDYNIAMPFLVPQDITEDQTLLGWIISQLLKKAEQIDRETSDAARDIWQSWEEDPQRMSILSNPFRECKDALLRAFTLRSRIAVRQSEGEDYTGDLVYSYMDAVRLDTELLVCLLKLISMMIDYYRYRIRKDAKATGDSPKKKFAEPLIFFTIDDLDLTPTRSSEVIELVLRYLQHPNVVIICGWNQEQFQNHLSMEFLRNQGVLDSNYLNTSFGFDDVFMERQRSHYTALISARRLAQDNLKKAFPPSQRYEIRGLSLRERASFPFDPLLEESVPDSSRPLFSAEELKPDAEPIQFIQMGGKLIPVYDCPHGSADTEDGGGREQEKQKLGLFALVEKTVRACSHVQPPEGDWSKLPPEKDPAHFLHDAQGPLKIYMRIFDNKARGLNNIYRAFESLLEKQKEVEAFLATEAGAEGCDITDQIRILLDAILYSNTRFAPYRRGIRDLIEFKGVVVARKECKTRLIHYCNFGAVKRVLEKHEAYRNRKENQEDLSFYPVDGDYEIERKYDYFPYLLVDVFLLLNFMENFLYSITQNRRRIHGGREFSELLNDQLIHAPLDFVEKRSQNQLLADAIIVGGVKLLRMFPDTSNFELNLSILNAYELRVFSGNFSRYHFTGFNTLWQIFQMVREILYGPKNAVQKADGKGSASVPDTDNIIRADAAWFADIMRLFAALRPDEANIRRLAAYLSLSESSGSWTNALDLIPADKELAEAKAMEFGRSAPDKAPKRDWDAEMDLIVGLLHINDEYCQSFQRCWASYTDYEAEEIEKEHVIFGGGETEDEDDLEIYRQAFKYNAIDWKTDSMEDLRRLQASLDCLGNMSLADPPFPDQTIQKGKFMETLKWAILAAKPGDGSKEKGANRLLRALQERMRRAFEENYKKPPDVKRSKTLEERYNYLQRAAAAVRNYAEHWDLVPSVWSELQVRAGEALLAAFRRSGLENLASGLETVLSMGPSLSDRSSEEYSVELARLRQYVYDRSADLSPGMMSQVLSNFQILEDAPKHVRPRTQLEAEIYRAIIAVGTAIAKECAAVSIQMFSGTEKQRAQVWPVSARHDGDIRELEDVFAKMMLLEDAAPGSEKIRSRFDVKYSPIELYLQGAWSTAGDKA